MRNLQSMYGLPKLEDKLFLVSITFPNDDSKWTEVIQAETADEAVKMVQEFYRAKKKWARNAIINSPRRFIPTFDGGEGPNKWPRELKGIPDQYVSHCAGGGINLHIYTLSGYRNCYGCGEVEEPQNDQSRLCEFIELHDLEHNQQQLCNNTAHCAGEQAGF